MYEFENNEGNDDYGVDDDNDISFIAMPSAMITWMEMERLFCV